MAQLAPSESRESAGDAGSITARAPVDLAALTHHDDFLLELGEVLGGRASVHPADSLDVALEKLQEARGGQILAIDAREAKDVRADVERACTQNPHAVILLFTAAGAEKSVAAAVKGTRVFTVLPLPIEPDKTSAVLDAALADAAEKAAPRSAPTRSVRQAAEAPRTLRPDEPAAASAEPPSGDGHKRLWLALGAGVVAVAVAAGLFLWPKHHVAAAHPVLQRPVAATAAHRAHFAALPRPDVDTSIVQGRVEDLLVKASRAMFARHFTAPKGDNALVFYRSVLAVDPTNGEARDGLRRVGNVVISRFKDAIRQGHYNAAALALATLQLADPTNRHIHPFGIDLSSAVVNQALSDGHLSTAPALIAQAARRGVPAAQILAWQSELSSLKHHKRTQKLVQQLTRRITAQRLTGSASATSTLARLRTLDPNSSTTANATQAVLGALLNQARQAGLAGHSAVESQAFAAARANGASRAQITAVQEQIQSARTNAVQSRLQRLLEKAHARLDAGELLQPANDSAAHYLNAVAADHPDPATAAAAKQMHRALANALLQRAEAAARNGQHSAAVTDLTDAQQWGASGSALHAATVMVDAPRAPTAAELADVARQLHRTHYVSPSYPVRALTRRISGEVTVQYIVDPTGRPRQLKVIAAKPTMVFDRAALDAIRRWRYAPPRFHGRPVSVPVRTLIRFVLPN